MTLYVLSDLHIADQAEGRLFDDRGQGRSLAALCERVLADEGSELIFLGDAFDFTAMLAPERGLDEFEKSVGVDLDPPPPRDAARMCADLARHNPVALEAIRRLCERARVTFVPGNHDHQLGGPEGKAALGAIGLGKASIETSCVRELDGLRAVLQHGHELDEGNKDPGGSGEQMTRCLHHAVIPYLKHHGARRHVKMDPDRVVSLRPEESVVSVLQRWLDPDSFHDFFRAYLKLLAENGYLPRFASWLAGLVSVERVRGRIESADKLWERAGNKACEALRGERRLPHDAPRPDVLVFGHTHVLDWAIEGKQDDKLYVNLGTWTERTFDASGPPDTTLPLLELRAKDGRPEAVLRDLSDEGKVLQRFQSPEPRAKA